MNLVFVVQVKNLKNAVALYKKNIKQLNRATTIKEITKLIFDLKKFSIFTMTLFFLTLSALRSSK